MKQRKYNYYNLKKDWAKPLPEDVNGFLDKFAKALKSEALVNRLARVREKKLFGKLRVYDGNGIEVMMAVFHYGVCKNAELNDLDGMVPKPEFIILFNRSIKNPDVEMSKRGEDGNPRERQEEKSKEITVFNGNSNLQLQMEK